MTRDEISQALCTQVDSELFFPERGERTRARDAKAVCTACPVRDACLADAMAYEGATTRWHRHGVFGGLGPAEREQLAKGLTS